MKEEKYYDKAFFDELKEGSYLSAKKILPLVQDVVNPASVLDIGCGSGDWLKVWKEDLHVNDLLGIEGTYVTEDLFEIDKKFLQTADLKIPLNLNRKFDLVISMEVAEHIPENCSDIFINNLVNASDIILFSAAIIGQLGTYHINEQMPEYWAKKFLAHEYIPVDFIRPKVWNDNSIQYWYRQNTILYIKRGRLIDFPKLKFAAEATNPDFLTRIHPEKYFAYVDQANQLQKLSGFIKYKLFRLKKWVKARVK